MNESEKEGECDRGDRIGGRFRPLLRLTLVGHDDSSNSPYTTSWIHHIFRGYPLSTLLVQRIQMVSINIPHGSSKLVWKGRIILFVNFFCENFEMKLYVDVY